MYIHNDKFAEPTKNVTTHRNQYSLKDWWGNFGADLIFAKLKPSKLLHNFYICIFKIVIFTCMRSHVDHVDHM